MSPTTGTESSSVSQETPSFSPLSGMSSFVRNSSQILRAATASSRSRRTSARERSDSPISRNPAAITSPAIATATSTSISVKARREAKGCAPPQCTTYRSAVGFPSRVTSTSKRSLFIRELMEFAISPMLVKGMPLTDLITSPFRTPSWLRMLSS